MQQILSKRNNIEAFLNDESIAFSDTAPMFVLHGLAERRLRRKLFEQGDADKNKSYVDANAATVTDIMNMVMRIRKRGVSVKKFMDLILKILIIDEPIVVFRHNIGPRSKCYSIVSNGQCKCGEYTAGVAAYSFQCIITDPRDINANKTLRVKAGASTGLLLFGMSAADFAALPRAEKLAKIENVTFVPISAGIILEYKEEEGSMSLTIHSPKVLGDEFCNAVSDADAEDDDNEL